MVVEAKRLQEMYIPAVNRVSDHDHTILHWPLAREQRGWDYIPVTNLKGLVSRSSSDMLAVVEAAWAWTIVRMRSGVWFAVQC